MTETTPLDLLIERCADGDRRAFEQLYSLCSARLFGLLLTMLRQRDLAEDVLQDTFVQVWRRASSFQRERGHGEAWITSIARNRAIDWLRRGGQRETLAASDDLLTSQISDDPSPDHHAGEVQANEQLYHCLDQLKPQQRTGIRLAFIGGLSHSEIAAQLNTPLGTAKSWIKRGLAALKRCLNRGGLER